PRELVLIAPAAAGAPRASWAFQLEPLERDRTRLVVRGRVSPHWLDEAGRDPAASGRPLFIERVYGLLARLPRPLLLAAGGFGHRVMQNQQLRGIKRRAEVG
ncbi:MAG TPA: hypothetical protein VFY16_10080, partial [Gemmatimonadaceae bacterium]|nr:hypothetical protein [Gemmatimonadaceae bacterium]